LGESEARPEHSCTATSRQREGEPRVEDPITPRSSVTDGGQVLAMAGQSLVGNPTCCRPNVGSVRRELVKRTLTYPERSLIKRSSTNLGSNWPNAQRHNRNGYWSNAVEPCQSAFARIIRHRPILSTGSIQRVARVNGYPERRIICLALFGAGEDPSTENARLERAILMRRQNAVHFL
jgi:hypothetical protein